MDLSQKVWKYTEQYKENIEDCLSVGIEQGTSATKLSRQIRQYLNKPNKLFRRVRDEHGQLRLSKNAKAYHPGAGVYRSSYKNALRLTRTEINMAYRYADYERWKDMDFVLGVKIQLSDAHPEYDICDILQGDYPKEFKFGGWHPHCLCFATPILQSEDDFIAGKEPKPIKELPQNFKDWYEFHKDEIQVANENGKLPYFLRDNQGVINYNLLAEIRKQVFEYVDNLQNNDFYGKNLATGKMKITHRIAKDFMQKKHCKNTDEMLLLKEIGENVNKLKEVDNSFVPLDMKKPKNNLQAKLQRKVIGYRQYEYLNNKGNFIILFENRSGYEVPYAVITKKR